MLSYSENLNKLASFFSTDLKSGLSSAEARRRIGAYGKNILESKKKRSFLSSFFDQFKDAMIIILLISAAISFFVAFRSDDVYEYIEPCLIVFIVMLNAFIGTLQENKAENALEALKTLTSQKCRVIRDGKEQITDAELVVPGDIISVCAGDAVCADARIIKSVNLRSEESALTGESVPSDKDGNIRIPENTAIGDRKNMLFSGCTVTSGHAYALVTETGMSTEMGRIAKLLSSSESSQTPLQEKLSSLGKILGIAALSICAIVFFIGVIFGMDILEIFMVSISLAVSAIPEGLPAIVTVVLSLGVQRMVKRNVIIRKLPAVETLGGASVICSDKTGTLTLNRMTLLKAYVKGSGGLEDISGSGCSQSVKKLLKYAVLCCDGDVQIKNKKEIHIGDPTETAIISAAMKNGIDKGSLFSECPRIFEVPFDSDRKLMTSVNRIDGRNIVITKGAFDVLKNICVDSDFSDADRYVSKMGKDALRVIGIAYKEIEHFSHSKASELEGGLHFMGLLGMIDPPREEAALAVSVCRQAGIKPVMITGDHVSTAAAIARQIGILDDASEAVTGAELSGLDDSELSRRVQNISVYARVSPEDKIRIVRAWQGNNAVVAMTGDGVNDAPALKAADIGCAMGITGTDVAKGASDMILTDDNFATIVDAVKEGRGIYSNIKKTISFLLTTNTGELLTIFIAMLLWHKSPLMPMHLLWINLVTDSLPAIALGMEPVEKQIMSKPPRPKNEGIFSGAMLFQIIWQGLMFSSLSLIGYFLGMRYGGEQAGSTVAFIVLCMTQCFHAYNMRSDLSLLKIGAFKNRMLNISFAVSSILVALVTFIPAVANIFGFVMLPPAMYLLAVALAFVPVVIVEIMKALNLYE